ncbi:MAG TPA: hypothetical protein VF316_00010, partial [Polyangiaceae bacterium]
MRAGAFALLVVAMILPACKSNESAAPTLAEAAASSPAVALKDLQGKWKVASSTGELDKGQAFREMIGEALVVEGDVLSVPAHA